MHKLKVIEPGKYVGWDDYTDGEDDNVRFKDNPKVLTFSDVF